MSGPDTIVALWRRQWPEALAVWSKFTRLSDPRLCETSVEASRHGLSGSFAMIRLVDQSVVIDVEGIARLGLQDYGREILAHEIGHHVLAPGSAVDQFRLLARIRAALPTLAHQAPMVANLYTDLLINDRLHRQASLRMPDIYRILGAHEKNPGASKVWALYMRIYEIAWQLDKGSLGGGAATVEMDTDAWLGAKIIRVYAGEWLTGGARFATLILPYLVEDKQAARALAYLHDTRHAALDCDPAGAQIAEMGENEARRHPVDDEAISGMAPADAEKAGEEEGGGAGQAHEPFEYGEILRAAGISMSDEEIAVRYYRERALPMLVPFPKKAAPLSGEPQMEGIEPWVLGDPLDELDWMQTLLASPRPIPGLTTMRRVHTSEPSHMRKPQVMDLDMYVDSSGSMVNPQVGTSYPALAGAIIALSALRAGASVKVTLWSSKKQVMQTPGFIRDSDPVLKVLTAYFGGGTDFPIHCLRETYAGTTPLKRPVHILMISDYGIDTMFDKDEKGNSGWDIAARALKVAGGGGTMALDLASDWDQNTEWMPDYLKTLKRAQSTQGWHIHPVNDTDQLIDFARAFSRRHYT